MNRLVLNGLKKASKIVAFQCIVIAVIAVLGWVFKDVESGQSILVGGVAAILPNSIFALFLFSTAGASQLKTTMSRFQRGATIKLILSSILLALAIKSGFLVLFVFIGFIAAICAHVFTPVSI